MSETLNGILNSPSIIDYITRLDLKDGRSLEGVITVYNQNSGSVRLANPEDISFIDFMVDQIQGLEILDYRPVEWSL